MKSKFTLIELIVVIVVLGILAAIVIPNISSYSKEAKVTALAADARSIETSVDMYAQKNNGHVPTLDGTPAEYGIPEWIDVSLLTPEYLKKKPKHDAEFYLEHSGNVIVLGAKLPNEFKKDISDPNETKFILKFDDEDDLKKIEEIKVVQVDSNGKIKDVIVVLKPNEITMQPDGTVEIIVKNPAGSDGKDLGIIIVDKNHIDSPIINGDFKTPEKIDGGNKGESGDNSNGSGAADLPNLKYSTTENTDGSILITVEQLDSIVVAEIMLPNGNKVTGNNATYTVSANGVYEFKAISSTGKENVLKVKIENTGKYISFGSENLNKLSNRQLGRGYILNPILKEDVKGITRFETSYGTNEVYYPEWIDSGEGTDLAGIEYLINLSELKIGEYEASGMKAFFFKPKTLEPLSKLKNLKYLEVNSAYLLEKKHLSNLPSSLEELTFQQFGMSWLALNDEYANVTNLQPIESQRIKSTEDLSHLTKLKTFKMFRNKSYTTQNNSKGTLFVEDFSGLANLPITTLWVDVNETGLNSLNSLPVSFKNRVTDLTVRAYGNITDEQIKSVTNTFTNAKVVRMNYSSIPIDSEKNPTPF